MNRPTRKPPVFCTPGLRPFAPLQKCNKTHAKNLCPVGCSCGSFWMEASKYPRHTFDLCLAVSLCCGFRASYASVTLSKASKAL